MNVVSVREARALLDVASAVDYDTRAGAFTHACLTPLLELIGADWVTYSEGRRGSAGRGTVKSEVETRPFAGHTIGAGGDLRHATSTSTPSAAGLRRNAASP